jgi:hypothetical protein
VDTFKKTDDRSVTLELLEKEAPLTPTLDEILSGKVE